MECPNCGFNLLRKLTGIAKEAKEVLEFLNQKTGKNFQPVHANMRLIRARLKESSADTCRQVIAMKCREWLKDEKMCKFLRPETLFGATKFAQYQGELGVE